MAIREMTECWSCGKSYDLEETESCPYCGQYHNEPLHNRPDYIPDFNYGDNDDNSQSY